MGIEEKIIWFEHEYNRFTLYKEENDIVLDYSVVFDTDTWETDHYTFSIKTEYFRNGIEELILKKKCSIPMIDDRNKKFHFFDSNSIFLEEKNDTIHFGFKQPYIDMEIKIDELRKLVE